MAELESLKLEPFPQGVVRVKGYGEKIFRVRIGDYRILYYVDYSLMTIFVIKIDKRETVYD